MILFSLFEIVNISSLGILPCGETLMTGNHFNSIPYIGFTSLLFYLLITYLFTCVLFSVAASYAFVFCF